MGIRDKCCIYQSTILNNVFSHHGSAKPAAVKTSPSIPAKSRNNIASRWYNISWMKCNFGMLFPVCPKYRTLSRGIIKESYWNDNFDRIFESLIAGSLIHADAFQTSLGVPSAWQSQKRCLTLIFVLPNIILLLSISLCHTVSKAFKSKNKGPVCAMLYFSSLLKNPPYTQDCWCALFRT